MSRLILPSSVKSVRRARYYCRLCEHPFYQGEERAYERHVIACATDEKVAAIRPEKLFEGIADEEFERWVRENKQEILEKRVRM